MKLPAALALLLAAASCAAPAKAPAVFGPTNAEKAPAGAACYASVIELKPESEAKYRELHAAVWPEVLAAIKKANISDYRIYRAELGGKAYLFSTFTYTGSDFKADMDSIGKDPTTKLKWWPLTDACQTRLPGTPEGQQWTGIEQLMRIP